jgi:hypothetical protein
MRAWLPRRLPALVYFRSAANKGFQTLRRSCGKRFVLCIQQRGFCLQGAGRKDKAGKRLSWAVDWMVRMHARLPRTWQDAGGILAETSRDRGTRPENTKSSRTRTAADASKLSTGMARDSKQLFEHASDQDMEPGEESTQRRS